MTFNYESNPLTIEKQSFQHIRQVTKLDGLSCEEQQVAMRIVHSVGIPEIVQHIRFSSNACSAGCKALADNRLILCDTEMVKQGITKRLIKTEPQCYLNDRRVKNLVKKTGETRSMAALFLWQHQLKNSVVIIGNAPTALFRLLEMLKNGCDKPALIIGMPVGFIGAAESKQALWDLHKQMSVQCITLLGQQGGSAVVSACCNALLRCNHDQWY